MFIDNACLYLLRMAYVCMCVWGVYIIVSMVRRCLCIRLYRNTWILNVTNTAIDTKSRASVMSHRLGNLIPDYVTFNCTWSYRVLPRQFAADNLKR